MKGEDESSNVQEALMVNRLDVLTLTQCLTLESMTLNLQMTLLRSTRPISLLKICLHKSMMRVTSICC
jgi:hypothetical protein